MKDSYQIRVHIIEARQLRTMSGQSDLPNPVAKVHLNAGTVKRMQATDIQSSTSSCYFDETKIFSEQLVKEDFQQGQIHIRIEDDRGFFSNQLIGEATLDLTAVHDSPGHEIFGRWVPLLAPDRGVALQGFLRVTVVVLRTGEQPKPHGKDDLLEEEDGDLSLVMGMPELQTETFQLTIRVYRAEIATFMQPRPDAFVRVRFAGSKECKTHSVSASYTPVFNDELSIPLYTPTLSDRILIDVLDKAQGSRVITGFAISLNKLRAEEIDPQWFNMYGPRPNPAGLTRSIVGDAVSEVDSSFKARLLLYASIERVPAPKHQRLPMILSKSTMEEIEPEAVDFKLRCDLYEAIGFPLGPLDSMYVILSWGGVERKSSTRSATDGKVQFESPHVGREGYYEQLDEITAKLPPSSEQQYDVFVHVYVQNAVAIRRLGFKRYKTKSLMAENGWSAVPQWTTLNPDPAVKSELSIHGAMLQVALRFGTDKQLKQTAPKRPHVRIPKLVRYELRANIYQARDIQPADENGLSDPYVKVSLAGSTKETATIERTLQPIWYQSITMPLELPRDLTLAPKIALVVYDSDAFFGVTMMKDVADPVIGLALAPAAPLRTLKDFYCPYRPDGSSDQKVSEPEWLELYDPDVSEQLARHAADPQNVEKPPTVGALLASFELRPEQDAKKAKLAAEKREAEARRKAAEAKGGKGALLAGAASNPLGDGAGGLVGGWLDAATGGDAISAQMPMPKLIPCYIEVSLVGVRDMQPRTISGVPVEISAPYVEFEYGHRSAAERLWKTRASSASASNGAMSQGPNANFLETLYLQVELPDDPTFMPVMGVRVRESARLLSFLPGGSSWADPICGVCSVPLGELMPSYARHMAQRESEAQAALLERRRLQAKEEERKVQEGEAALPAPPLMTNEEVCEELLFESHARENRNTRAAALKRGGERRDPVGDRTIADPDPTDLELDEEDEGDDEGAEGDPTNMTILEGLETRLKDVPFEVRDLHLGAVKSPLQGLGLTRWGKQRKAGLIKMKVRVLEEASFVETVRSAPPPRLKQLYAEKMCKIRLYVYTARDLTARSNGEEPQPFLKVFNGAEAHQIRTTRDKPVGSTLNPELYSSFELSAYLPGQSQLHVEVWDYSVFSETQIGETVIDLEDRLFSPQWQEMQRQGQLPRETRQLLNAGTATAQGVVTLRVEILERKYALANPMVELAPPVKDQYELRVIVWEARDVAIKDEATGQSDVFVTAQPRGDEQYEKQTTDTHFYSSGDAEFNWRMIWPVFLPEKVPRLFMQVWDYDLIGANDAIGEAELNLKPIYDRALKRKTGQSIERQWVPFSHPNFLGVQARVCVTVEVLTRAEAVLRPAGKKRDPPNENPHLEEPLRPTFLDSLGINFNMYNPFLMFRKYYVRFCVCLTVVGAVVLVIVLTQGQGGQSG
tara:strand:- start:238 stop:4518 length:4281 start_codon:yes stop_codon:yes gene_type:complete